MLVVGGIPLFYMELALGQFNRKGAITCWGRLVQLFKGKEFSLLIILHDEGSNLVVSTKISIEGVKFPLLEF